MEEKVLLFSMNNDSIKVTIEAWIDAAGSLIVEGYDIGKRVEEYWGDSDYEYSITVYAQELKKLFKILNITPENAKQLLVYLQTNFNTNSCFSDIRKWLDSYKIHHEGFSWT